MQRCSIEILTLGLGLLVNPHPATSAESTTSGDVSSAQPVDMAVRSDKDRAATDDFGPQQQAEQQYADAQVRYEQGDLRGALLLLKACHAKTNAVNLVFNIAQLHRDLDECAEAVAYYQRYVTEAPNGERVGDALRYLELLRPRCTPTPARPPITSPQLATADSNSRAFNYWSAGGWIALGVGAVATVATVYTSIEANRARSDLEQMSHLAQPVEASDVMARYDARSEDFYRNRNWAFALGAVAVTTVGFGVYALAVAAPDQRAQARAVSAAVLPGGALLDCRWSF